MTDPWKTEGAARSWTSAGDRLVIDCWSALEDHDPVSAVRSVDPSSASGDSPRWIPSDVSPRADHAVRSAAAGLASRAASGQSDDSDDAGASATEEGLRAPWESPFRTRQQETAPSPSSVEPCATEKPRSTLAGHPAPSEEGGARRSATTPKASPALDLQTTTAPYSVTRIPSRPNPAATNPTVVPAGTPAVVQPAPRPPLATPAAHLAEAAPALPCAGAGGGTTAVAGGTIGCAGAPAAAGLLALSRALALMAAGTRPEEDPSSSGWFGRMFYWIEYETGMTDEGAFDSVTLDDGLGGQAYGVQFDLWQGSLQQYMSWALARNPELYSPFAPLALLPKTSLYATSQLSPMPQAWHAVFAADRETFAADQKAYITESTYFPVEARLEAAGWSIANRDEVVKGAILSYAHQHGPGSITPTTLSRAGVANDDSDEEFLRKLYEYRTSRYGSYAGLDLASRYRRELATALALLSSGGSTAVSRAEGLIGEVSYLWGGCEPGRMDCSGFVSYCLTGSYTRLGTTLTFLTWPPVDDPQPGDVAVNRQHCGIYAGDGRMIDCGNSGVHYSDVWPDMVFVRYPG